MTERDEQALRAALQQLDPGEPVETTVVRRRVAERRRNRRTVAALAVALVLVGGVVGLPRVLPGGTAEPAGGTAGSGAQAESAPSTDTRESVDARAENTPTTSSRPDKPPADQAPAGWRTEYYRDISFQVPQGWGYAVPPGGSWCAGEGKLRAEQRTPYVWLGTELAEAAISCPPLPERMLSEHVRALAGPATDYIEGAVRQGSWWVVTRFAGSAVLVVTTQDKQRAERILNSAQTRPDNAPCRPSSPMVGPNRPDDGSDLTALPLVDRAVLCQYEPGAEPPDAGLPRLRAAVRLDRPAAQALVDEFAAAPVDDGLCIGPDIGPSSEIAVLVQIWADGREHPVFVNARGCSAGGSGMSGGIDDGTTVRLLTRDACRRLLVPPIDLFAGTGDVGTNCIG